MHSKPSYLDVSISLSQTYTHTHTYKHMHIISLSLSHRHTETQTHTQTHIHTHAGVHTHTHTHSYMHVCTCMQSHKCGRMHTLILLLAVEGRPRVCWLTSSGKRFLMKGLEVKTERRFVTAVHTLTMFWRDISMCRWFQCQQLSRGSLSEHQRLQQTDFTEKAHNGLRLHVNAA